MRRKRTYSMAMITVQKGKTRCLPMFKCCSRAYSRQVPTYLSSCLQILRIDPSVDACIDVCRCRYRLSDCLQHGMSFGAKTRTGTKRFKSSYSGGCRISPILCNVPLEYSIFANASFFCCPVDGANAEVTTLLTLIYVLHNGKTQRIRVTSTSRSPDAC